MPNPSTSTGTVLSQYEQNARQFLAALEARQYRFFTGVPCSLLASLIECLETSPRVRYVASVREDAALGLASGAYLAGQKSCVLMQNSGLGYSLNVLTSFNLMYKIPLLLIVSFRGYQGNDAPEHILMGGKVEELFKTFGIPYWVPGPGPSALDKALASAEQIMLQKKIPAVLLIRKGIFG